MAPITDPSARHQAAEAVANCTPAGSDSNYLRGLLLLRAGNAAAAAECLIAAIGARPRHEGARINLVRALLAAGDPQRALAAADAALTLLPRSAELHFGRGTALNALGHPLAAREALERAIMLDPAHAPSRVNLGNSCADLDDLATAERCIRTALRLDPGLLEAHASLGFVLTAQGRLPEAIAACESAIALSPDYVQAHWNLAAAALLAGDFARGFGEYEWRKRHPRFRCDFPPLPGPAWTGDDPSGRTILVRAEQGFGDAIQLARYLPLIAASGGRPVLACPRPLLRWLETLPGVTVVPRDMPLPHYDAWIDQMSLPLAFLTEPDGIPASGGYLRADSGAMARWDTPLLPRRSHGPRIGLAWAGNPSHGNDRRRSLPPEAVMLLRNVIGGRAVNLQVGPRARETDLPDHSPLLDDFAETAALVANLDLVVSVDTAVAHVAGALGVRCWLMLPFAPDWRWMLGRNDSPWYTSLRLFRQQRPDDWDSVIAEIRTALHRDGAPDRGNRDTRRTSHSVPGN